MLILLPTAHNESTKSFRTLYLQYITHMSVWPKLRASFYEAQIGLGARLNKANPPPPLRAPR